MRIRDAAIVVFLSVAAAGCGMLGFGSKTDAKPVAPAPPTFVNRLWRVTPPSDVAEGTLYAFFPDNTLLITPAAGPSRIGRWAMRGDQLLLIEEGFMTPADVVELNATRFALRQQTASGIVNITMTPAAERGLMGALKR